MKEKLKKVTINRARWLVGVSESSLYRSGDKKMCCLGFVARSCGALVTDIKDEPTPCSIIGKDNIKWPSKILKDGMNTDLCRNLMGYNDDPSLGVKERESLIKKGLRAADIAVKFVGRYTK